MTPDESDSIELIRLIRKKVLWVRLAPGINPSYEIISASGITGSPDILEAFRMHKPFNSVIYENPINYHLPVIPN